MNNQEVGLVLYQFGLQNLIETPYLLSKEVFIYLYTWYRIWRSGG